MADIETLKQALAVSPNNTPLILMLAEVYLGQFSLSEAQETFEQALSIEPNNSAAKVGIARVLELNGKSSEAIIRMEQLCAEDPEHAPAWLLRSKLALGEGDGSAARKHYDQAVSIDAALVDEALLQRIVQAGGAALEAAEPQKARAQTAEGWQAELDEGGEPLEDAFGDEAFDDLDVDFVEKSDVDFSKVGGMEAVKEDIRMKILYPLQNKDLFAAYGKKAGGGVLLYGPPGCGKTLISRATAGEIDAKFISVGLHQILDMWMGKSEEKLHELFELARRHAPSVLFFDEIDALAADRKDLRASAGRTLINQFLAELDGSQNENDGVLVLGATNVPWHLDSAFLRPGRFDRLIFVPPPDELARMDIVNIMAEGKPVAALDAKNLAKRTKDFSGADIKAVFDQATEAALGEAMKAGKMVPITAKQLAKTAKQVKPSTRKWFESAKNYALYANQSGFYDEVLDYLGIKK
ncbi:MAG: AAA family ATPase [Verrucomicrobiales bacterium]|nr:AAA family ATPase [Verrucomicrobiales bacterium]